MMRMTTMTLARSLTVALAAALAVGCATDPPRQARAVAGGEAGIQVLGIELMADGDLARLDYKVIDFETARRTLEDGIRIFSQDGGQLGVMSAGRLGPIRQRPSKTGKKQFIMFANPGRALQKGDSAVLLIGEIRVAGIPVT